MNSAETRDDVSTQKQIERLERRVMPEPGEKPSAHNVVDQRFSDWIPLGLPPFLFMGSTVAG